MSPFLIKSNFMNRKKTLLLLALMQAGFAMAGGLLTNTNQSVHFLRNPARDASTEIDAVYTNPAGLVKLGEGFHFSFNNQSAFQTRTITSTYAPFAGFGGSATKEFKGEASAPIIPSIQAAYKKGDWVLSGSIAVTGGGGKATFNNGLPSFESQISVLPIALATSSALPIPTSKYSVDSYMEGASFIYGAQLGGTYTISDQFSAYAGFRMNIVNNSYVGHLRNIQINPNLTSVTIPGLPAAAMQALQQKYNGSMVSANEFFTTLGKTAEANATKDKNLDCDQSGWGITPVLGVNYNWNEKLNVGVKYEFRTALNVENKTKIDDTGLFKDGVNTPHDIPALLTVGASYKILPKLTASVGYHHFFDSDAKMADDKQKNAGSTNEYLAGLEYRIDKMFLVSAGGQITDYGVNDAYQRDLSFACSSYSIGLGGSVNVSPKVKINLGYFWTTYSDYTKTPGGNTEKDVFSRTNKVFGAGVDFSF